MKWIHISHRDIVNVQHVENSVLVKTNGLTCTEYQEMYGKSIEKPILFISDWYNKEKGKIGNFILGSLQDQIIIIQSTQNQHIAKLESNSEQSNTY